MKHVVNVGLLFCFLTLLASGLLRFFQPFSLVVTRVHIAFGFATAILVGLHLSSRGRYFRNLLRAAPGQGRSSGWLQAASAAGVWALTLVAAIWNAWPVSQLIGQGYEAQHTQEIFRPHRRVAYLPVESGLRVHRGDTADTGLRIEFDWGPAFGRDVDELDLSGLQTQLAIWAENEEGDVLETIYVSEASAASGTMTWGGRTVRRKEVLPVWQARYEKLLGEALPPDVDAVSSATPTRDFSMDGHLQTGGLPFALYVEINAAKDPNPSYQQSSESPDRPIGNGQPSVVYEARIYPSDQRRFYLMELIGHGGVGDLSAGEIDYDLGGLTTAKQLIDKVLIEVAWPESDAS
ncbi:hypothetical protein MalM25_07030 [Planctomycetes bacterium MalM25]|nr:hypothetical protein MalM25_07030 [Planctomycetes bacterium MalM25]